MSTPRASAFEMHVMARLLRYRFFDGLLTPRRLYDAMVMPAVAAGTIQRASLVLGSWPRQLHYCHLRSYCFGCKTILNCNFRGQHYTCNDCAWEFNKLPPVYQEMLFSTYADVHRMLMSFNQEDQVAIMSILQYKSIYNQPSASAEHGILPQSYRTQLQAAHVKPVEPVVLHKEDIGQVPATL